MEKTALVTGSTNNIGKAIAEVLSGKGFHVIVTSRNGDEAWAVSEKLPRKGSHFRVDFSQVSSIEALFAFIRDKFRRLDVLVNNVAYTKNESILECDLDTWEQYSTSPSDGTTKRPCAALLSKRRLRSSKRRRKNGRCFLEIDFYGIGRQGTYGWISTRSQIM
jgi:NADP-dependent 3-hydroxy acid dehydrogenase YdfG